MVKDPEFAGIRNLAVERAKNEIYDRLKTDDTSLLKGTDSGAVFMQAMALGYKEKRRVPLSDNYRVVNISTLTEEHEWLIKSLAIAETGGLDILNNPKEVLHIAEEYANGGIDLLQQRILSGGSEYPLQLEEELHRLVESKIQRGTAERQA